MLKRLGTRGSEPISRVRERRYPREGEHTCVKLEQHGKHKGRNKPKCNKKSIKRDRETERQRDKSFHLELR